MPHLPPEHFEHNVDALAERQPDVADAVRSVPVPAGVSPATGRDGAPTLRVPGPDGDLIWFGGSSMPTVSADAIVGRVPDDGGNVTLPGVLTGLEPLLLTRRLPPHVATFVVESDLASLRLALHVYDYAPPIRAGRLVFITGADIVAHLRAFFDAHPGYAFPARLISVPHRAPSALAELTARLEHAADEVTRVQTRLIEHACKRLQARAPRAHTFAGAPANAAARDTAHAPRAPEHRPRVAVVSVDVSPATCAQTARIARALARLEWPHEICIPDAPDRCHVLARLAAVDRAAADFVLIVNGTTGLPRALLPDTLPVVSWCLPGTPPTMPASQLRALSADLRPADMIFVSSATQRRAFASVSPPGEGATCDVDDAMLCVLEVAADDAITDGAVARTRARDGHLTDIAVVADLPDDQPEAANITLHSHLALWRDARRLVRRGIDRYRDDMAAALLADAQRASGTTLQDADVQDRFVSLIRDRIAPAAAARAAVEALVGAGHRVHTWGRHWQSTGDAHHHHGPIDPGATTRDVAERVDVAVFPLPTPAAIQEALDALLAGVPVIWRAHREQIGVDYPRLADIAGLVYGYRTASELVDTVGEAYRSRNPVAGNLAALRSLVARHHTVSSRLVALRDLLREHVGARGHNA